MKTKHALRVPSFSLLFLQKQDLKTFIAFHRPFPPLINPLKAKDSVKMFLLPRPPIFEEVLLLCLKFPASIAGASKNSNRTKMILG